MRRRTALSSIAAAAALPAFPAAALGAPRYDWHPRPIKGEPPHPLRRRLGTRRAWTIDTQLLIRPWDRDDSPVAPTYDDLISPRFTFKSTVVTIPYAPATSLAHPDERFELEGESTAESRPYATGPRASNPYPLGTRLAIFNGGRSTTTNLRVKLKNSIVAYDTEIDEELALATPWPDTFLTQMDEPDPATAARNAEITTALLPQTFIESDGPLITKLVENWTNGQPRRLTPHALVKYLASRVFLQYSPDNKRFIDGPEYFELLRITIDEREEVDPRAFKGLRVLGAEFAARVRTGSPYDLINLLVACIRAVGIPARPVIGIDIRAQNNTAQEDDYPGDLNRVHAWLEYYLKHPKNTHGQWIPFDALRLRRRSERTPQLTRQWDFLGHFQEGRFYAPISCHWHPPTVVVSPGPPALWGWIPETPSGVVPAVEPRLTLQANPTEQRGDSPPIPAPALP